MGLLSWIVFGALAGVVAGIITGKGQAGCLTNIVIGVIGAFIGGLVMQFITGEPFRMNNFGFDFPSFVVAVLGSVLLLAVAGRSGGGSKKKK